jgi:hypothetical protein
MQGPWPGVSLLGLGRSPVLVDHTAENLTASDRGIERDHGGRVVVGWVLVEVLVWAVVIEMVHILVEDGEGMSLVVDRQPVGALFADAANEPFGVAVYRGVWGGILTTLRHSEAKTASRRW